MAKIKKINIFILLLLVLTLVGCSEKEELPIEENKSNMYRVLDGTDNLILESENMWTAIMNAGSKSKNANRHKVLSPTDEVVFEYSLTKYYMYLSDTYVGATSSIDEAKNWANKYPNSYVIDGKANEFVALGDEKLPLNSSFTRGYELYSGSYFYMFSKKYNNLEKQMGYTYMSFTLRFSEATITYPKEATEHGWNAYVFVNSMMDNPWSNNDIGIVNNWEGHKGKWLPVFNLNGNTYNPDQTAVITQMELIDEETDTWGNADDLFFEIYTTEEEYIFNIKNLGNGKEFSFRAKNKNLKGNVQKTYLLLAASFCPVLKHGKMWNPRSGAAFENIIFENVVVSQYESSNDYTNATKIPYVLGNNTMDYALVEGADNADGEIGTYDSDGTYQSGNVYEKGTNYIKTSIYYDYRIRK